MVDHNCLYALSSRLVQGLTAAGKTVATAESCTGGWLAKAITDVPGSSAVLRYGIVSYADEAKESLLGVSTGTLANDGAVSEAVVRAMAEGAIRLSGADIAVAVSGVAGPDGGSDDKPVGTVWLAWAARADDSTGIETRLKRFDGDREQVRAQTVAAALEGLLERI